ncbi:MAG: hypothetical protein OXL68_14720 [Paracoccaceae bacterium]|nr:hypothetical protein [Paracoccaceae bacterium]
MHRFIPARENFVAELEREIHAFVNRVVEDLPQKHNFGGHEIVGAPTHLNVRYVGQQDARDATFNFARPRLSP